MPLAQTVPARACWARRCRPPWKRPRPPAIADALRKLADRWVDAKARERANFALYLGQLCTALDLEGPRPAGSGYEYEFPVKVIDRDGKESSNFVDLFKRGHFVLEAKDKEPGHSDELMLRKAYGQARSYVTHLSGSIPPYVIVLDIARTMMGATAQCPRWPEARERHRRLDLPPPRLTLAEGPGLPTRPSEPSGRGTACAVDPSLTPE